MAVTFAIEGLVVVDGGVAVAITTEWPVVVDGSVAVTVGWMVIVNGSVIVTRGWIVVNASSVWTGRPAVDAEVGAGGSISGIQIGPKVAVTDSRNSEIVAVGRGNCVNHGG